MKLHLLFFLCLVLILSACERNRLDIDTGRIDIPAPQVLRLEDDLFGLRPDNFDEQTAALKAKYGPWYEHYIMSFLNRRGTQDSLYRKAVLSFISDPDVRGAYRDAKKVYPDEKIRSIAGELHDCMKRFRHHFPSAKLPQRFITCTTGWNYAFAYMDSALIVGLDMYLGGTSRFYKMLRYPQYQVRRMNEAHILPDIARGWMLTEFDKSETGNRLLDHTIFYGKIFYGVEALLPDLHDSLIIGYSSQQMAYCKSYEKNLWGYFAAENRLYESNMSIVRELTTEGPFTAAISRECPPRIAMWVGWQIVKSYMSRNGEVTLEELMREKDAQKILTKSRYRP